MDRVKVRELPEVGSWSESMAITVMVWSPTMLASNESIVKVFFSTIPGTSPYTRYVILQLE